jgi:hypothetical protein
VRVVEVAAWPVIQALAFARTMLRETALLP